MEKALTSASGYCDQSASGGRGRSAGKPRPLRKIHRIKAVDMPAPGRGNAAERKHQPKRRLAGFGGRIVQSLPLDAVLVRTNEQRHGISADDVREASPHHLSRPSLALLLEPALLLKRLERLLQNVLRRAAVAAAPLR